jgi:hypothetical protein
MGRLFALIAISLALYLGYLVREHGVEHGLDVALEQLGLDTRDENADVIEQTFLYADKPSNGSEGGGNGKKRERVLVTDAVRERVTAHIDLGVRRRMKNR